MIIQDLNIKLVIGVVESGKIMAVQLLDKTLVMKPRRSHHVKPVRVEEVVDVPIEKQISIDKVSTKGLKSEEYANNTESKLDKLRKLRRGN